MFTDYCERLALCISDVELVIDFMFDFHFAGPEVFSVRS